MVRSCCGLRGGGGPSARGAAVDERCPPVRAVRLPAPRAGLRPLPRRAADRAASRALRASH